MHRTTWQSPPAAPRLDSSAIHIWRASLDATREALDRYAETLSADEREQASRFRFPALRDQFITCRGILREVLSCYTGIEPSALRLAVSSYGKPSLHESTRPFDLRFNVSNTRSAALYALSDGRELGVDLEETRPVENASGLAARFFSPAEIRQLHALDPDLRERAFLVCWTRKEAFIKAAGRGLSIPLDSFDVAFAPGEPARLLETRPDALEASRWTLHDIGCGTGYVAALVVEDARGRIECFDWRPPTG